MEQKFPEIRKFPEKWHLFKLEMNLLNLKSIELTGWLNLKQEVQQKCQESSAQKKLINAHIKRTKTTTNFCSCPSPKHIAQCFLYILLVSVYLHCNVSLSSLVGATSIALLEWQLTRLGSAPWLRSNEQTSTLKYRHKQI